MEQFLDKKYILESSENYEDYLIVMGLSYLLRKAGLALKLTQWVSRNEDGTYTFHITSKVISGGCTFTPGEEFEETKLDGSKCKSTILFDGNTMLQQQIDASGRVHKHNHVYTEDQVIVTTQVDGLDKIVKRVFKAVK